MGEGLGLLRLVLIYCAPFLTSFRNMNIGIRIIDKQILSDEGVEEITSANACLFQEARNALSAILI